MVLPRLQRGKVLVFENAHVGTAAFGCPSSKARQP
jgi:hypothetical protein